MFDYDGGATAPCKCFICERAFEPGELVAAPGFVFEPDFPHSLYGTKLVCDNCIAGLAEHRGYVAQSQHEGTVDTMLALQRSLAEERDALQAQLDAGVAGLVKLLDERRAAEKPKRAPQNAAKAISLEH